MELERKGVNIVAMAKSERGAWDLFDVYRNSSSSSNEDREIIFVRVLDSLIELMVDEYGFRIVNQLIYFSTDHHLKLMVNKVASQPQLFIEAARHGDGCGNDTVVRLIQYLKDSPPELSSKLTSILSTKFYELMADPDGYFVILGCLCFLGDQPNEVLFEAAINQCTQLAKHQQGFVALVNFIKECRSGVHRDRIMYIIVDQMLESFSDDDAFWHSFVLLVAPLGNLFVTYKICWRLRGLYMQLSYKENGSHIVEKLIESSSVGMTLALEDLLHNQEALPMLAQHEFGNNVIRTALKTTRSAHSKYYEELVRALRPDFSHLEQSETGKKVVQLITGPAPEPDTEVKSDNLLKATIYI